MSTSETREVDRQTAALEAYVEKGDYSNFYGLRYGNPENLNWTPGRPILDGYLLPLLGDDRTVVEIGSGGGRWSRYIMPRCRKTILVDGTSASEPAIRNYWGIPKDREVVFLVSPDGRLPTVSSESVDAVFSFDTFVHFDADLFWSYVEEIARVLKPGGALALHYAWDARAQKPFFRYYDDSTLADRFAALGLTVEDANGFVVGDTRLILAHRLGRTSA